MIPIMINEGPVEKNAVFGLKIHFDTLTNIQNSPIQPCITSTYFKSLLSKLLQIQTHFSSKIMKLSIAQRTFDEKVNMITYKC